MNQEPQTHEEHEGERVASTLMKVLAIVGLIAVLALAAWLSIQAIRYSPSAFSAVSSTISSAAVTLNSVFSFRGGEELALALEDTVLVSGEPTTVGFEHDGENAAYAFSFTCADNLRFRIQEENGEYTTVSCEEPYEFSNRSELRLIPVSETARFADSTVTLAVAGSEVSDTADITVVNESVPEEEGEPSGEGETPANGGVSEPTTPSTPTTPTQPTRPAGADLSIRVIGTGIALGDDRTFYEAPAIPADQKGAIKFVVENVGGTRSGTFNFIATLPIEGNPFFRYEAPTQQPLNPGDRVEYTLGFDTLDVDDNANITIVIRPTGPDANSSNNAVSRTVEIREAE
jgi:hypothetical protein